MGRFCFIEKSSKIKMGDQEYIIRYRIATNKFYCLSNNGYEEVYFYHDALKEKNWIELGLKLRKDINKDFEFDFKIRGTKADNFIAISLDEEDMLKLIADKLQDISNLT